VNLFFWQIEVADPKNKLVNLGARYVGDVVKKYIPVVNNSPAPITFHLAFTPSSPKLQNPDILSVGPTTPITLDPRGGTIKVEIIFKPKGRIPAFTEEVGNCGSVYEAFSNQGCG
jgi:hydrocephalus-inducing protein